MNEQTLSKLHEMKLSGMIDSYKEQTSNKDFQKLSFEERFQLLVDQEYARRKNNTLKRLIKQATFQDSHAALEDIEYHEDRKLDKETILKLSTCNYINDAHNIIVKGPTGAGKSFVAQAFGIAACRKLYKVKYARLPELIDELNLSKINADGSYRKLINKYSKVNLLILDEWLLTDISSEDAAMILEITESRYKRGSTIFCSQIAPHGWPSKLGNGTVAEAIMDRVIHDSYQLMLDGEISMRERHGIKQS